MDIVHVNLAPQRLVPAALGGSLRSVFNFDSHCLVKALRVCTATVRATACWDPMLMHCRLRRQSLWLCEHGHQQ